MPSVVDMLTEKQLISPPWFLKGGIQYEVITGSVACGVSDENSDIDIYGFAIPPKDYIFPHLSGVISGFDKEVNTFHQFQEQHVKDVDDEYDLTIYSIVNFFRLCMENNPNIIDSLFVPERYILHSTKIGDYVREKRKSFLYRGAYHKFRGCAYNQLIKIKTKKPQQGSKRYKLVENFGFDVKFSYHVVRMLNEAEQILVEGDIDFERSSDQLKSIRNGEWSIEQLEQYFEEKGKYLESLYTKSKLPNSCDEKAVKKMLLECLEMHYGSLPDGMSLKK